jgi:regulatory protein
MALIITKIEQQNKNKKRYSLFSGDEFVIGVSDVTLIELDIHQGLRLSEKILDQIKRKEKVAAIREQAWRYLARREHSIKELSQKLARKNFTPALISFLINDLKTKDYLNDQRYARQLLNDEINLKKNGPLLIKGNLLKKGIEINLTNELLDELYTENKQRENCDCLAGKKLKSLEKLEPELQKKRLVSFLTRKGFTWETISRIISDFDLNHRDESLQSEI